MHSALSAPYLPCAETLNANTLAASAMNTNAIFLFMAVYLSIVIILQNYSYCGFKNQMSKILSPTVKLIYLSLTLLPDRDPL